MSGELAVVLTAGGRIVRQDFPDAVLEDGDSDYKCLLKVGGHTLLEVALDAVRGCGRAEKVVVVGNPRLQRWLTAPNEVLIPERVEAHENFIVGLEAVAQYRRVLYLTTDLPFVTAKAVSRFIDACPPDVQVCYAVAQREAFEARFPNSPSIYARLRDGEFAAGCAAMVEPAVLLERREWIRQAARRRKSLWRLALLVGGGVLWKYATRRLTVADVERRAEWLLGARCRAVPCDPVLAYDIDTPQDYLYALRYADGGAG
ncbi:MAG: nucleotidyltransferase family protein [Armatimonadota bacterium]